jgi:hypothetical protein
MIFSIIKQRGSSVAVRPLWRSALAATVNRFAHGVGIGHFVMAITTEDRRRAGGEA